MKWDAPEILLALFLAAAALCVLGGSHLAREELIVHEERARTSHEAFIRELDGELDRLMRHYQSHLRRLCLIKDANNSLPIEALGRTIVGVKQFSLLAPSLNSRVNVHLLMDQVDDVDSLPVPTFTHEGNPLGRVPAVLDHEALLAGDHDEGWIDDPGKPLFYWKRRADRRVVVLLINQAEVQEAIDGWLAGWLAKGFLPVDEQGGPDQLISPKGSPLAAVGLESRLLNARPSVYLSVPTQMGAWRLASWDRARVQTHYRVPVLIVSGVAGVGFLLLGMSVYVYQRRALRLAKTRASFVNQVSHELRSPLTNILLNTDLAHDAVENDPYAQSRLRLIQEEAHRLGRLIANVLTFSRRESGRRQLQWAPVDSHEVIGEVISQFAPSLERHGIVVEHDGRAKQRVLLDRDALFQIMANLVSNVEKYGVSGHELKITSRVNEGRLCIQVADRGPGIAEKDRERIFESFVRLDGRVDEGASGTGLGLAIARGLAEDMGGSLALVGSDEGASFELDLPAVGAEDPSLS